MQQKRFIWKLYGSYVFLIVVLTVTIGILVSHWLKQDTLSKIQTQLQEKSELLMRLSTPYLTKSYNSEFQQSIRELGSMTHTRYTVIKFDGVVIADSDKNPSQLDNHGSRPEILQSQTHGKGTATRFSDTTHQNMMYLALLVSHNSKHIGYVRSALPLTEIDEKLANLNKFVLLGAIFGGVIALILGYYLAQRIVYPLISMTKAVQAVSKGDFSQTIHVQEEDEIGALAKAFNEMTKQLKERIKTIAVERERFYAILSSMIEGVVAIDHEENIVHINEAACKILNCDIHQSLRKKIWEVTSVRNVTTILSSAMKNGHEEIAEVNLTPKQQILEMHATPLKSEKGRIIGAVVVMHDLSHMRRLESIRRDFVANVSHEFKTPVTAIRGIVETLLDDEKMPSDMHNRFLSKISSQTSRLTTLVSDLLTLSRLESEKTILEKDKINLKKLVLQSFQNLLHNSELKKINMTCSLEDELYVMGDQESLRQCIDNLLDNAIKYTPEKGEIFVNLVKDNEHAVISIKDSGIGIEPIHLDRIFERFYRVDKARSTELGGTGLGLSIVKHVIAAHGGTVSVNSIIGTGSIFYLKIPLIKSI